MGNGRPVLVGIDPSFTRTGVSFWIDQTIYLGSVSYTKEGAMDKTFQGIYKEAERRSGDIVNIIGNMTNGRGMKIISECPFHGGEFSSGLWALDSLLFHKIRNLQNVEIVYNLSTTYLTHIHGRKYHKSDSVNLAKGWIEEISKRGIEVKLTEKRLSNDACESFIFLMRLASLEKYKVKGESVPIVCKCDKLLDIKEKILYMEER